MPQAILVASFGTRYAKTRANTIGAVEAEIRKAYPGHHIAVAYTSRRIRHSLAEIGIHIDAPEQAMERLLADGFREILVQPTYLICGEEYDRLLHILRGYQKRASIRVGLPMLATSRDLREASALLCSRFPQEAGVCTVFMGHGSPHPANAVYPALAYRMQLSGRQDLWVATVDGYPTLYDILPQLKTKYRKVRLAPLMLVAGEHAFHDMAGENPKSWKSVLQATGMAVELILHGLGEDPDFRAFYLRHMTEAKPLCS